MADLTLRFLIGGAVVSIFSVLGDALKPKSFSGIFAAAPTIALSTLCLTMRKHGVVYVETEARSMLAGALSFFLYACVVSFHLMRYKPSALRSAAALLPVWAVASAVFWAAWLRW